MPSIDFNEVTFSIFAKHSGYIPSEDQVLQSGFLEIYKDDIVNQLSNKVYASWQRSQRVIAARIPAQSKQSFMEMENVSYMDTDSNDIYVSVLQIFIQGSDFDIDKAYIMGHGFNKMGHYELWNDMFTYEDVETLKALENLPMSSSEKIRKFETDPTGAVDISIELANFVNALTSEDIGNFNNPRIKLSVNAIKYFEVLLKKLEGAKLVYTNRAFYQGSSPEAIEQTLDSLRLLINKYNTEKNYLNTKYALVNFVISGIGSIISTPQNQIFATAPVDIDPLNAGADEALKLKMESLKLLEDELLEKSNNGKKE